MKLMLMLAATALPLAGCGSSPIAADTEKITVVPGDAAAGMVGTSSTTTSGGPAAQISGSPAPAATPTPRTLTVAESALIRTDEMWSEPIAPGDS